MRPVAILRFSPTEGPAYFAEWLDRRALDHSIVALDAGARVPADPRAYAGLALMGGPMGVNDALPWIEPVCALLRAAVAARIPVLGHCLGGQLLAKALGAEVARAGVHEIGWIDVDVTDASAQAAWFGGRPRFTTFQWHYDAFALPHGATRVLGNAFNANQAYVVDGRHIGMQCHIEMTRELVETWVASGASELPTASSASAQSAGDIRRDLDRRLADLRAVADDVYARWATGLVH
ncbi:MAG TPA: type 1 glutamine amidotransferase [Casimicrobiaceae bacterium]|jgi:GMP synthase-like glutamine amidotransferase|nr:type 1 glutamine amidotransferase [Casimicrobiaceae bacterium]